MKRIATIAATTATAGLLTLTTATVASADTTSPRITNAADAFYGTPEVALDFRNASGNRIGSGMFTNARFEFAGTCRTVKGMRLVLVTQIDNKSVIDGYGSAYQGFVRREFANLPPNMPC